MSLFLNSALSRRDTVVSTLTIRHKQQWALSPGEDGAKLLNLGFYWSELDVCSAHKVYFNCGDEARYTLTPSRRIM
jgi:hypothetical protein